MFYRNWISILVLLLPHLIVNIKASFDPYLMCSLIANGTKIKDPRACNTWIQCINEQPINGTCEGTLFYNRSSGACVPYESINCISSNPCAATAGTNGFVADPYSCNGYYYCSNGTAALGECSAGLNFNPGTQNCIRNFPCTLTLSPDSYCNIVPDGVFIKNLTNCKNWQMCWNGVVVNGTCPGTFYFNPLKGNCDYPENVECVDDTTEKPIIAENNVCAGVGDFIADNETCNGYYYCQKSEGGEFILEHGQCSNGRFFASNNGGSCVPRSQIYCQYDRCAGLGTNQIQLSNESNDGCVGFAICQDNVTIGYGVCPNNEYFDEGTQLCTTQVISYPACVLSTTSTTTATESMVIDES